MNPQPNPAFAWAEAWLAERTPGNKPIWEDLPVEASHRRFFRATISGVRATASSELAPTYMLMTSPPALEQNAQFLRLARRFRAGGLAVPEIHAIEEAEGYFLLEDLGTCHLADVYGTEGTDRALAGALDALVTLQAIDDPELEPYSAARLAMELGIFSEWFVAAFAGASSDAAVTDGVFPQLIENALDQLQVPIHRDFHCRNLLLGPTGKMGIVDFQDALVGPVSYDLASLLRDCYHVFDEATIRRWQQHFLAISPLPLDASRFTRQFDLMALQRQLKAVGIFARLYLRDGKRTHLRWILPVLARISDLATRYHDLAPLARWVNQLQRPASLRLEDLA